MEKKYMIKCRCGWTIITTGLTEDLKDLYEYKGCTRCSGRKFRCPKCGGKANMFKVNARRG